MRIYLSGHTRKAGEGPDSHWRDILTMYFEKHAEQHYKAKKVYPLPSIRFTYPLEKNTKLEINAARDKMLMNSCDIAVCYLNLNLGRCLGGMFELGYLKAIGKPILLINESSEIASTKFIEHNASVVSHSLDEASNILYNMLKDISEENND
jgi:nucleoside 2-deoxyribosyltransferase